MENFIKHMILPYFIERDGIICIKRESVDTEFTKEVQDFLFENEDNSWWFQFRAILLEKIAEEYMNIKKLLLDVGGGMDIQHHIV